MKLGFLMAKTLDIARTDTKAVHFSLSHQVGGNRKRLYYRRSQIKNRLNRGFLLSFVARLAIANTVSCDYYPRSSIVKSVFNCRLPGMFNINTARALSIARFCFVFKL